MTTAAKKTPRSLRLTPAQRAKLTRQIGRQLAVAWARVDASNAKLCGIHPSRAQARAFKRVSQRIIRVDLRVQGLRA